MNEVSGPSSSIVERAAGSRSNDLEKQSCGGQRAPDAVSTDDQRFSDCEISANLDSAHAQSRWIWRRRAWKTLAGVDGMTTCMLQSWC